MPGPDVPAELVIAGEFYRVAGAEVSQPLWTSRKVPSQLGDPSTPRVVALGSGVAGMVGSSRSLGRPSPHGIDFASKADTTVEDIYGAGPFVTLLDGLTTGSANGSEQLSPGTTADDAAVGAITWSDPNNSQASDDAYATAAAGTSHYLKATNFGFSLPASAVPVGIQIDIERKATQLDTGFVPLASHFSSDANDGGTPWIDPANVAASDDVYAVSTGPSSGTDTTEILVATSAGLTVPSGATILGIEVQVERKASSASGVSDFLVRVGRDGIFDGDEKAQSGDWGVSDAIITYGGATDLWGRTWTPTQINADLFGVAFMASITGDPQKTASIDHIQVKVYYSDTADSIVRLVDEAGGIVGSNKAQGPSWPIDDATTQYGGATDMWGTALTKTEVEHANFGVVISVLAGTGATASIDHIQVTVHYVEEVSAEPSAIWSDGLDSVGRKTRYIYVGQGSRLHVIDPITDTEVATVAYGNTVDGFSAARWAGLMWYALRGDLSGDFVQRVSVPWNGSSQTIAATDYFGKVLVAGPDALYRGFRTATNEALVKKTNEPAPDDVDGDVNWAPTNGEQVGDPGVPITQLQTLGRRLIVGKEDGVGELDIDFVYRSYLPFLQDFHSDLNANGLLSLGQSGNFIATHRRGLYLFPDSEPMGVEVLDGNRSAVRGRYHALAFDGAWVWAALYNIGENKTRLVKMRPRRLPGPGRWEHHPVVELDSAKTITFYLWPGANIDGTEHPPRLWFGAGDARPGYIVIGEDVADRTFTSDEWSITWPADDFESPGTMKWVHKVEMTYADLANTNGITWTVEADEDGSPSTLTDDGLSTGTGPVTVDGFAQRFGLKDESDRGRRLRFKMTGSGSAKSLQMRGIGQPVVTILEQPTEVDLIGAKLQLATSDRNEATALEQFDTLGDIVGRVVEVSAIYSEDQDSDNREFHAVVVSVDRAANIEGADASGVIMANVVLRAVDFS